MGERSPLWNDDARGVFFGLSRNHKREHMMRAVFESTGFSLRNILEEIENTGREVKIIRSSGGLTRIHLVAQIKADILGKEIYFNATDFNIQSKLISLKSLKKGTYLILIEADNQRYTEKIIYK